MFEVIRKIDPSQPEFSCNSAEENEGSESDITSMDRMQKKLRYISISDAVHNKMRIHPLALLIVDTPEFQRLRQLKQCGISHFVYPSANHTRFEHSIGVSHLAHLFTEEIEGMHSRDQFCIELAGLCHDLGHGPFSHLWEKYLDAKGIEWKHEAMSLKIFNYMTEKYNLSEKFKYFNCDGTFSYLTQEDFEFISRLILGKVPENEENEYLYEIINNGRSGMDVDKWEYIVRDSTQFGITKTIDKDRLLDGVGLVTLNGVKHVGFRDKVKQSVYDVYKIRAELHMSCYQHLTCKKLEAMLLDALASVDDKFTIEGDGNNYRLWECHQNVEAFIQLTDDIFSKIMYSPHSGAKAKELLNRILTRDLYTLVFKKEVPPECNNVLKSNVHIQLNQEFGKDFSVAFRQLNFGISNDAMESVYFFSKETTPEGERKVVPVKTSDLSFENPRHYFNEMMVFCKEKNYKPDETESTRIENFVQNIISTCS